VERITEIHTIYYKSSQNDLTLYPIRNILMTIQVLIAKQIEWSTASILNFLQENDKEILSRTLEIINHIHDRWWHPQPPYAKPLRENTVDLCEIRSKFNRDELLRIYYFVHRENWENRLVLLNAIIKPDWDKYPAYYEGTKGKRLKKEIEQSIELALELQKDYLSQLSYYEYL
jgi:hypothetical protein